MYNILVFGMTENPGGVESFLMNYYRYIDKSKFQFDFLCNSYEKVAYEDEILKLGGKTFHFPARSRNPVEYYKALKHFFGNYGKKYCAIWVNVSSLANIDYLKFAKKCGIPKRIIHSHNSKNMDNKWRGLLHWINRKTIAQYATDYWACSEEAADWFYEKLLRKDVVIIRNAIDVEKMAFDNAKRTIIRKTLDWEDNFIIGNIGRLHFQKNQMFILEIFSEVQKQISSARLVLVGQGEDETKLKKKAKELNIEEDVYFAGLQYDVAGWLSAFDFFLFPSRFEGLGIVALEAQANGLMVLASKDVIPTEVSINDNFEFLSLDSPKEEWKNGLISLCEKNIGRVEQKTLKNRFITSGYDIETEVKKLEELLGEF